MIQTKFQSQKQTFIYIFLILVVLVAYYFGQNVAIIFHDYGSTLAVIGWLFFFWWFSYSFVLEDRDPSIKNEIIKA